MADPVAATDLWSKFVSFIREFGLPSFLVIWFLFRIEKKLDKFTAVIGRLLTVNVVILKTMEKNDEADDLLKTDEEKGLLEQAKDELGEGEEASKKRVQGGKK